MNKSQDMGTGSIPKLLAKLAIPAVVAQIVNLLYNIVDRIYIGHIPGIGAEALTGVGLFTPILMLINAFAMLAGVNNQFASFYGGTSLLILVGVVLDTLQQIESYLLMRHYDGLMKTGRLSGRSGM